MINVDLQGAGDPVSTSTMGAMGGGSVWNAPSTSSLETPLLDSSGAVTSVTLWRSSGFFPSGYFGDALYGDGFVGRVEIRGLEPNSLYEMAVYGVANVWNEFLFDGEWLPYPASVGFPASGGYEERNLPGAEGINYVHGKLRTDESGVLGIESDYGAIAGLQFTSTAVPNPEPSTVLLSLLGGLVLFRRRRVAASA